MWYEHSWESNEYYSIPNAVCVFYAYTNERKRLKKSDQLHLIAAPIS